MVGAFTVTLKSGHEGHAGMVGSVGHAGQLGHEGYEGCEGHDGHDKDMLGFTSGQVSEQLNFGLNCIVKLVPLQL